MTSRAQKKQQSFNRILDIASVRLREQGLDGAAIAPVMKEAGLTHGAFYAHFANKDELARAAFRHALDQAQPVWFGPRKEAWHRRLARMAASYLSPRHRDTVGQGCAVSALVTDFATADDDYQATFNEMFRHTIDGICDNGDDATNARRDEAIAFLALCVGGINLARAVGDPTLSRRILRACRQAVNRIPAED